MFTRSLILVLGGFFFTGKEPDNYLTYFKRATAYLSLGRNDAAADDFSTILNLKPDFDKALMQRARIYAKEGHFKLAKQDLEKYLDNRPSDKEAQEMVIHIFIFAYIFHLLTLVGGDSCIRCDWLKMH